MLAKHLLYQLSYEPIILSWLHVANRQELNLRRRPRKLPYVPTRNPKIPTSLLPRWLQYSSKSQPALTFLGLPTFTNLVATTFNTKVQPTKNYGGVGGSRTHLMAKFISRVPTSPQHPLLFWSRDWNSISRVNPLGWGRFLLNYLAHYLPVAI